MPLLGKFLIFWLLRKKRKVEQEVSATEVELIHFSPLQMAEKPSYQLLHVSSLIAHMAKHLLVGGQIGVFLMLTETCLKAASLDWNLDNPVDQCCFLWVSGGAWQLEGLLVPARGTSQSVGTMGRGPQSPPFPFSLLSATHPSMTHLLTQPARENPCLQYSIFNDNQITCRFYSLKQQATFLLGWPPHVILWIN